MVILGAPHFYHWEVLAQPGRLVFHSCRHTVTDKSAPLTRPFLFVSLRVLKAVFVFSRVQSPKLMHVKQPDREQKLDQRKN